MKLVDKLFSYMNYVGFNPTNGKPNVRVLMFMLAYGIMVINLTYFINYKCDSLIDKVNTIRFIVFQSVFFVYCVVFLFFWKDLELLLSVFENGLLKINKNVSCEMKRLAGICDKELGNHSKLWDILIGVYLSLISVIPVTKSLLIMIFTENYNDIDIYELPLPYPFYYPEQFNNIWYYFVALSIHSTYNVFAIGYAYLACVSALGAMTFLKSEIILLKLFVIEMDERIDFLDNGVLARTESNNEKTRGLKLFIEHFVENQQSVYKKFKSLIVGIKWVSITFKTMAAVFMCMTIFIIEQNDDVIIKIEELVFCSIWMYSVFLLDMCGEHIANEDENLRKALYECQWYNKPKWFKKSWLIIMTQSNKCIQIKPFGLFTLNFRNFTTTINAVYSYYNLLRRLK